MIHVVSGANQHLYARQLDQMFRLRHDPHADRPDDARAGVDPRDEEEGVVYLMSLDTWGEVAASLRLNSGPTGWTVSRWSAPSAQQPNMPRNPQHELMVGLLEFCERHDADVFMMEEDAALIERLRAHGWRFDPIAGAAPPASRVEAGPATLVAARQTTGVAAPVLIDLDPDRTAPSNDVA